MVLGELEDIRQPSARQLVTIEDVVADHARFPRELGTIRAACVALRKRRAGPSSRFLSRSPHAEAGQLRSQYSEVARPPLDEMEMNVPRHLSYSPSTYYGPGSGKFATKALQ